MTGEEATADLEAALEDLLSSPVSHQSLRRISDALGEVDEALDEGDDVVMEDAGAFSRRLATGIDKLRDVEPTSGRMRSLLFGCITRLGALEKTLRDDLMERQRWGAPESDEGPEGAQRLFVDRYPPGRCPVDGGRLRWQTIEGDLVGICAQHGVVRPQAHRLGRPTMTAAGVTGADAAGQLEAVLTEVLAGPANAPRLRQLGRELDRLVPILGPLAPEQREALGRLVTELLDELGACVGAAPPTLERSIALTGRRLTALQSELQGEPGRASSIDST